MKLVLRVFCIVLIACGWFSAHSQSVSTSGTIQGIVVDPSSAAIAGASVEIRNPVSQYTETTATDEQGKFVFRNIPFNNYHLTVNAKGFQNATQDVDIRSAVPVGVRIGLTIGTAVTTMSVETGADLIETDPATHTDVDRALFNKLPLESQSSSLSSL